MRCRRFRAPRGVCVEGGGRTNGRRGCRRRPFVYRHTRASSTSRSNAFMQVQAMFEPRAEYIVEGRRSDEVRAAEDADAGGCPPQT